MYESISTLYNTVHFEFKVTVMYRNTCVQRQCIIGRSPATPRSVIQLFTKGCIILKYIYTCNVVNKDGYT